jgi:putative DNA primase/helicase
MSSAIESATSDPRVGVATSSWDSYPQLIGVQNGVIDLKTGELLRGQPDLYITRRAPVAYTPGLTNERWAKFVDEATNGDKELQAWLQMAAGYTLTGYSTQDVLFLVYGPPGSGKNTFVEAIVKCLGTSQYAWPLDSSILAQGDGQSSSTDLYHWAELRGRRMVWVDELPESERIKENAIKKLTGSSEISARSPGEKPFTFQSQAKLWLTTNHRPIITDDAMWRRLRPIPWTNRPAVSDPSLKEFLFDPEGGLPAVLAWAVEGAMRYLNSKEIDPLGWCTAIYEASDMYRRSEDRIGMFLNEETKEVPGGAIPVKSIYSVYRWWSEERGEKALSQIAFVRKMRDRGIDIVGDGSRAELMGRVILPKAQSNNSDGSMNWDALRKFDM